MLDFVLGIVDVFVVMAVECPVHAKIGRQVINCTESVWVTAWSFVRDQNIRALSQQRAVVIWENGASMLTGQSSPPPIALAALG